MSEKESVFRALRRRVSRRKIGGAESFKHAGEGIVDWMRETDVKIGYFDLTVAGEPVVILIGRAQRAADLTAAYEALNVAVVYAESFDPPLKVPT